PSSEAQHEAYALLTSNLENLSNAYGFCGTSAQGFGSIPTLPLAYVPFVILCITIQCIVIGVMRYAPVAKV
ncbi:hypothetical protein KIL84_023117, partial [Mauremys mutica]